MTHPQHGQNKTNKYKEKTSEDKSKHKYLNIKKIPGLKNKRSFFRMHLYDNRWFIGLGLFRKFQQYRRLPQDPPPPPANGGNHLEEELDRLTGKIVRTNCYETLNWIELFFISQDNLLCKIEGQDQESARGHEEECVVCGTNRASMQTLPCSHQVTKMSQVC